MLSISRSMSDKPGAHSHFDTVKPESFKQFANIITTKVWSPIVWDGGRRAKEFFLSSEFIALDFDSGEMSVAEAQSFCRDWNLWHVIGVTKSHQIEKVSGSGKRTPPCDRFRLVFRAKGPVSDRSLYEYNMGLMAQYFPCDVSCKDGGRFFWPCKQVVAVGGGGHVPWLDYDDDFEPEEVRFARRREYLARLGSKGLMPPWLERIIDCEVSVAEGERHKTCYQIGAVMTAMGYEVDDIVGLLTKTSLMDIGEADLERAVNNGAMAEGAQG